MKRHEGIKPYECTLCPAKFGQKGITNRVKLNKNGLFLAFI